MRLLQSLDYSDLDFQSTLNSAINEAIVELLGAVDLWALLQELSTKYDVSPEELPYQIETVYRVLETKFGVVGAKTIGPIVAEKFYAKLGLAFHEHEGYVLSDYVQDAKKRTLRIHR